MNKKMQLAHGGVLAFQQHEFWSSYNSNSQPQSTKKNPDRRNNESDVAESTEKYWHLGVQLGLPILVGALLCAALYLLCGHVGWHV